MEVDTFTVGRLAFGMLTQYQENTNCPEEREKLG
jgi:hypothetical protein